MSRELEKLYREDKFHVKRWAKHYTDKEFYEINRKLRKKLVMLIKKIKKLTGRECFIVAMIMHHGFTISASKKALQFEKRARVLGYERQKWLVAAIIDRLLQLQGKPQKYGTQIIKTKSGKIKQYELDGTVSDRERKDLGLPPLKQLKKYLKN